MACVDSSGTLTESGRQLLGALGQSQSVGGLAGELVLPVFRVRGILREAIAAGFVAEHGEAYTRTSLGDSKLSAGEPKSGAPVV